jgi:hypothetical protein
MQRDASYSELRLRDDTCIVWVNGEPRINAAHLFQDLLTSLHQVRSEWPPKANEIVPGQLCMPGEEHYCSSLEDHIREGERSGRFIKLSKLGPTVFDQPTESEATTSSPPTRTAEPMPYVPEPEL